MGYSGRALFTILKSGGLGKQPWLIEEYRSLPDDELFRRLALLGVHVDEEALCSYAEEYGSPEELTDSLATKNQQRDKIYLLIFEAWRRLCPESQTISLFVDELDYQIELLEKGGDEKPLQKVLFQMQRLLDNQGDPKSAFEAVSSYSANDLEAFLYDYIFEKIDKGHTTYSSELIDGFLPYMSEPEWFYLLRLRLLPTEEGELALDRLFEEAADHDFLFEVLRVAISLGPHFAHYARKTIPKLEEDDLPHMQQLAIEYLVSIEAFNRIADIEEASLEELLAIVLEAA